MTAALGANASKRAGACFCQQGHGVVVCSCHYTLILLGVALRRLSNWAASSGRRRKASVLPAIFSAAVLLQRMHAAALRRQRQHAGGRFTGPDWRDYPDLAGKAVDQGVTDGLRIRHANRLLL